MAWQKSSAELREVKSLEGSVFHGPIIEIEAVYVEVCYHSLPLNKQRPPSGGPGPAAEATGVVLNCNVALLHTFVK
jgi:hypothetical protein